MNICCRLIFVVAFSILSNVIFGQEHEEREVVEGYLVIKNSKYTVVTVPGGPENLSDYTASYIISNEYRRVYEENAANKDWLKKYDHQSLSETLGKLARRHIPAEYLPKECIIHISCVVSLSGRIDTIAYFIKNTELIPYHQGIPAEVYVKLDKAIKENIRFPSWKDKVPYKCPTIVWYF